ncbi:hypothetical protein CPAR01_14927 [Colletotrichum paranaense]|uniref:Uncharacterized protein n=1 Tax=Colletotrichum paranaense TaxID=1914294 RepID=A0ABQ9S0B8_9PEZI|nr:uncharacterized protein CPAR01_14927 [Colletotrichum paranaense]KAK1521404.1 hypothetical protein CPAR01_14927 [Colletotrichum paranaense]
MSLCRPPITAYHASNPRFGTALTSCPPSWSLARYLPCGSRSTKDLACHAFNVSQKTVRGNDMVYCRSSDAGWHVDRDIVWVHVCPPASHVRSRSSTDVPAHRSSGYYRKQNSITDSIETARDVIREVKYMASIPELTVLPFIASFRFLSFRYQIWPPPFHFIPPYCPGRLPSTLDRTPSNGSFRPVKPFPYMVNLDLKSPCLIFGLPERLLNASS